VPFLDRVSLDRIFAPTKKSKPKRHSAMAREMASSGSGGALAGQRLHQMAGCWQRTTVLERGASTSGIDQMAILPCWQDMSLLSRVLA
jgi:hypothetical protein